jgi:hypothetical protein
MNGMDDLREWLWAQLKEDERLAREAVDAERRRINAARRILDLLYPPYPPYELCDDSAECGSNCEGCAYRDCEGNCDTHRINADGTLRLLALPYEDRPGYLDIWRA